MSHGLKNVPSPSVVLVQAHLRLLARVCGSRSPDLLVVPIPVPVPAFPCFPVAPFRVTQRFVGCAESAKCHWSCDLSRVTEARVGSGHETKIGRSSTRLHDVALFH